MLPPTPLDKEDSRSPFQDPRYCHVDEKQLPLTKSFKKRVLSAFFPIEKKVFLPALQEEWEILVAAHGNSLRGIIKVLKNISDEQIGNLNLPTAVPYVFEFDDEMHLIKDYFLGDPEEVKKLWIGS